MTLYTAVASGSRFGDQGRVPQHERRASGRLNLNRDQRLEALEKCGLEARSFAGLMKKRGEARRAAGEAANEVFVEETDEVAAAGLTE